MTDDAEQLRYEAECRYWLKETGGKKSKVEALMVRITAKRGQARAAKLLAGMHAERDKQRESHK